MAIAKLTRQVMMIGQNFGGNKPPDSIGPLLPFPPEKVIFADGKTFPVTPEAARIFFKLVATGKIPRWAAADLIRYTQQWKELAKKR
jgi:hypothetical protein